MSTVRRLVRAIGLQALGGLVVWLIVAAAAWNVDTAALDIVTVLLLFAQLVVVPLGLLLVDDGTIVAGRSLISGARFLFRIGAVAAIVSLALPKGELSAAVAAIYLLPAAVVAAASVLRAASTIRDGSIWRPPTVASVAAGVFLGVGALFFVLHRQGAGFAGLHDLIVQLAAVHFHFIGFGLVVMAGEASRRRARTGGAAVVLLVAGMVLMPVGFLTESMIQLAGALVVVGGTLLVVVTTLACLPDLGGAPSRVLFVSCVFAVLITAMGAWYAIGEASGRPPFPVEFMARVHGVFAALGVVGLGLLGWRLAGD